MNLWLFRGKTDMRKETVVRIPIKYFGFTQFNELEKFPQEI